MACCLKTGRTSSTCRGTRSCPTAPRGGLDNPIMRGVLNGWQLSGISTLASGVPVFLGFGGQAGSDGVTQAIFGTPDIIGNPGPGGGDRGGLSPVYTCDPRLGNTSVGEKLFDINCIGIPAFGDQRRPDPAVQPAHADAHQPRPDGLQELRHHRATRRSSCESGSSTCSTRRGSPPTRRPTSTWCSTRRATSTRNGMSNGAGGIGRQRLRPNAGVQLHAEHHRQLREGQPEAWAPCHRVRPEVLLLGTESLGCEGKGEGPRGLPLCCFWGRETLRIADCELRLEKFGGFQESPPPPVNLPICGIS